MIDFRALAAYFSNDDAIIRRFLEVFTRQTPQIINRIDESLAAKDAVAAVVWAGTLRNQIRYFGYPELVEQLDCFVLKAGEEGGLHDAALIWSEFVPEFIPAFQTIAAGHEALNRAR